MSRPIRLVRTQRSSAESPAKSSRTAEPLSSEDSSLSVAGSSSVDVNLFESPEEQRLYDAYKALRPSIHASMPVGEFVSACERLADPMAAYFDKVWFSHVSSIAC